MKASGAISMMLFSISLSTFSYPMMSYSESYSGRRYGLTFSAMSPGRNPSRSPASTAGRQRTMRLMVFSVIAAAAAATARNVFPVPAGPMAMVMSNSCMA